MPSKNWKPWWEKVGEFDTPAEREEFMRGIAGGRPKSIKGSDILIGIVAGYIGGKISQPRDKK